jgi:hypothetical protein
MISLRIPFNPSTKEDRKDTQILEMLRMELNQF